MPSILKPNNYWTKEKCHEEALKYKTRSEFDKNNATAYNKARKYGWLDEICSHMILLQKPANYWTKEKCKAEALKYKTRKEFRKDNGSAYSISCSNGWIDEICSHMISFQKHANYWTKERCHEEALRFKTRSRFQHNSGSAYNKARKKEWLDEICFHMTSVKKANDYWTIERCLKEALKYTTRGVFIKKSGSAYGKAKKNNWLDEVCSHMVRIGNRSNKLIYAYEFPDNKVYVGLTYNIDDRKKHRDQDDKDAVTKYAATTGLKPVLKRLTDYIPVDEAIEEEANTIKRYQDNGWVILNKSKAGSIGGNVIKWTKEELVKESNKYKSRTEFAKKSPAAYNASLKKGLRNEIHSHMPFLQIPNGSLTKQVCRKEALKYKTRTEFARNSSGAYDKAWKNDWLDDICDHMTSVQKPRGYWTKETCRIEALKYKTRSEFQRKSVTAYDKALKNGWMHEICSHFTSLKKPNNYWNKKTCSKEALLYKSKSEFSKKSTSAYTAARKNGWLDEICSHMNR